MSQIGFHPGHKIKWSYKSAIEFIALNDEPMGMSVQDIAGYVSVHCLSAASGKPCHVIAHDVKIIRDREKNMGRL